MRASRINIRWSDHPIFQRENVLTASAKLLILLHAEFRRMSEYLRHSVTLQSVLPRQKDVLTGTMGGVSTQWLQILLLWQQGRSKD
jgi:hypothetical protein